MYIFRQIQYILERYAGYDQYVQCSAQNQLLVLLKESIEFFC